MQSRPAKSILIVDDDDHIRLVVSKLVERAGYPWVVASDGEEALAILDEQGGFDLIFLDVDMPGMNGFETLDAIRKKGVSTPVVMLTARNADENILRGYENGADYYITKPFHAPAVLNILQYLLGDLTPEQRAEIEPKL